MRPDTATSKTKLKATPEMARVHAAHPRIQAIAPTPERARRSDIRPPIVSQNVRRDAYEVVDVLARYGGHFASILEYARDRLGEETASLAASDYTAKVDGGGWRSHGGIAGMPDEFHEQSAAIERIHRKLDRKARAAAEALVDAMRAPRTPCPFEAFVGSTLVDVPFFMRLDRESKEPVMRLFLTWLEQQLRNCHTHE